MSNDLKQQIEQGLNTASMIAFAIPEVGPIGGALLTGGGAVFGALFDFKSQEDPLDRIPTEADIKQLEANIVAAIADAFDTHDLSQASENIAQHMKTLRGAWADTSTEHGLTFIGKFRDTQAETAWVQNRTNALQGPLHYSSTGETPVLLKDIDTIQSNQGARYKGVGLYIWSVNCFILFCKVAMLWEYVVAMRNHDIADYKTEAERTKMGGALLTWSNTPKDQRGKMPEIPPPLEALEDKTTYEKASAYITLMVDQLGGPDAWRQAALQDKVKPDPDATGQTPSKGDSYLMLQYLMETYDTVKAAFDAALAEYKTHEKGTTIIQKVQKFVPSVGGSGGQPAGTFYHFEDSVNKYKSQQSSSKQQVQLAMDNYLGAIQLGLVDRYVTQKGFGDWDLDVLADVKKVIDTWKKGLGDGFDFLSKYDDVHVPPLFDT